MEGVAWSVFLISLSLQLSAAYCPIHHRKDPSKHLPKKANRPLYIFSFAFALTTISVSHNQLNAFVV